MIEICRQRRQLQSLEVLEVCSVWEVWCCHLYFPFLELFLPNRFWTKNKENLLYSVGSLIFQRNLATCFENFSNEFTPFPPFIISTIWPHFSFKIGTLRSASSFISQLICLLSVYWFTRIFESWSQCSLIMYYDLMLDFNLIF